MVKKKKTVRKNQIKTKGKNAGYIKVKGGIKSKVTGKVYKKGGIAGRKKAIRAAYANGWKGKKK